MGNALANILGNFSDRNSPALTSAAAILIQFNKARKSSIQDRSTGANFDGGLDLVKKTGDCDLFDLFVGSEIRV